MARGKLFINTLVFQEGHQAGQKQIEMMSIIHDMGIMGIEVRREFFTDIQAETKTIGDKADELNMTVYYSIPEYLYENGVLQRDNLVKYFDEATLLNAKQVKLVVGEYSEVQQGDVDFLNNLCIQKNILLTIENDQTPENGKADKIEKFICEYRNKGGKAGITFDIGNFMWVQEDVLENAKKLMPYVEYIHLKNVSAIPSLHTVYLAETGVAWQEVLEILPKDCPLALEYPINGDTTRSIKTEIEVLTKLN